ncbi:Translin-like protein, partial [Globisporangium splendens]
MSMSGVNRGRRSLDTCRDEFTAVVENGKTKMRCNHCRMTISNHTATLKNHLARRHDNGSTIQSYDPPNANRAGDSAESYGKEDPAQREAEDAGRERDEGEEQEASSAAEDQANGPTLGKKDLKKRTQRSSFAQEDDSAVERSNQEKRQQDDEANAEEKGAEKKRKVDAVAPDAHVALVTTTTTEKDGEKPLPLIDHQEFADMNRGKDKHPLDRRLCVFELMLDFSVGWHCEAMGGSELLLHWCSFLEQIIPELCALANGNPSLRDGALSAALEEYVEAKSFGYYLANHRLLPRHDLPNVQKSEYLGGIIDLTGEFGRIAVETSRMLTFIEYVHSAGELMRYAVVKATSRNVNEVERCRAMVEAISGELIQFDFRNGPLRKKFDSVKYNLRKLENTLYELSLITKSGITVQPHSVDDEAQGHDDDAVVQ